MPSDIVLLPSSASRLEEPIQLAVVGAHLSGLPLNGQLLDLGAALVRVARTAPDYRLFALPGTDPQKPGLIRDPGFEGPGIVTEIWALSPCAFAHFVASIPAPLGVGRILMEDGTMPTGFLCEAWATKSALDISALGGWRAYIEQDAQQDAQTGRNMGRQFL